MIGAFRDLNQKTIELSHSSLATDAAFWLRIKPNTNTIETTAPSALLNVQDARVLIALLEKAIKEAED